MLTRNTIDALKNIPIADVVQHYSDVDTTTNGNICCPLHEGDNTPSFHLYREHNTYKCFGCGRFGDTIRFVMEARGVSFMDACKSLAQTFNIPLKEEGEGQTPEQRSEQEKKGYYYDIMHAAEVFLYKTFLEHETQVIGHTCVRYGIQRFGAPSDPQSRSAVWQLGVLLPNPVTSEGVYQQHPLLAHLQTLKGWNLVEREVLTSLMFRHHPSTNQLHSSLQNRIIIPLHDAQGHTVGFSGREVEGAPNTAKYLASKAHPFFKKGDILFGLDKALPEIRRSHTVFLVEGYADVMTLAAAGCKSPIALQGTSLTAPHFEILKRVGVERVVILPDCDEPGRASALKNTLALLFEGFAVEVASYGEEGDDPDSFFHKLSQSQE